MEETENRKESAVPTSCTAQHDMALFALTIPIMIVMVALAVVPLLVMSRAEHRTNASEARAVTARLPEPVNELVAEPTLTVAA
jgi:hypothetical protein